MGNGKNIINKIVKFGGAFEIALAAVVFLFSGPVDATIGDNELKEISEILKMGDLPFSNYSTEQLKEFLNKLIKPKESEVTYGILIMGAFDEMEFMDAILSQAFLKRNRAYFDSVLDKRIDLFNHWKKTGQNMYKIWQKGGSATPVTALALESIEMVNKTMAIFEAWQVLENTEKYKGLWVYFDWRRQGNEPHEVAWEGAMAEMGGMANSLHGFYKENKRQKEINQLEQQFAALYDKWGPYATPSGISREYKEKLAGELRNTLAVALESHSFVKEEPKPSLIARMTEQLANIKNTLAALVSQVNPFKAGPIVELPEAESLPVSEQEDQEEQEDLDDLLEEADIDSAENNSLQIEETDEPIEDSLQQTGTPLPEPVPEQAPALEPEAEEIAVTEELVEIIESEPKLESEDLSGIASPTIELPELQLCQKSQAGTPRQYRVLINEVAWMGSQNSPNDEWIELKNIWGIPVNLAGWQLQDKDQQIKIIFGENHFISASGYFLLERSKDYTGALNNTDEALYLFDDQCQLEDEVLANPNWPGGDNSFKKTMQRFDIFYWYTSPSTAGSENSSPPAILEHPSASSPAPTKVSYPKILIVEIQIEHTSSTNYDFIKLYNPNSETADVSGYQLKKRSSTGSESSIRVFPDGSAISAKSYFLWANYGQANVTSTQTLAKNNSIALFDPEKNILDQVAWGSSTNPFIEDQPYPKNPDETETLVRKWSSTTQSYIDIDDNSEDFQIRSREDGGGNGGGQQGGETPALSVVINEIAWMGTKANPADEWLELYNNSTSSINLAGWKIKKSGEDWLTLSTSTIPAQNYFLIERTDNNTVSDITADHFFTGALGNVGEKLELRDAAGNLIDIVNVSQGWFAGQASPHYTSMERINSNASGTDPVNWVSNNRVTRNGLDVGGNKINGTPKVENSVSKSSTIFTGDLIISDDFTLMKLGSPYTVDGSIIVDAGAKLIVESGVEVKFKHNSGQHSQLKVKGILEAQNATFTSYQADQPWDGLYFENSTSTFDNVMINYAGKLHKSCCYEYAPYAYGAVYIDGGKLTLKNSFVKNSQTMGVWLKNSTSTLIDATEFSYIDGDWEKTAAIYIENSSPTIQNSTFKNNNIGILVENSVAPIIENNTFEENQIPIKISSLLPAISGNMAQNNNLNGILLTNFGFADGISQIDWQEAVMPYVLESSTIVPAGKTLNIQPGVVVKLKSVGRIYVEGNLQAFGQEDNKIIFTALADDEYGGDTNNDGESAGSPGQWQYIYFNSSSQDSVLENIIVRYGGWYNVFQGGPSAKSGAVKVDNTPLIINNSIFDNNLYAGLELINASSTVSNTVFQNHTAVYGYGMENSKAIYVESGNCPILSQVTFVNNSVDVYPSNCAP